MRAWSRHRPSELCSERRQWCRHDRLSSVQTGQGSVPGERCLSVAHGRENDAPREVTMFTDHMRAAHQPFSKVRRLRRGEGCARCRALWAPTGCALRWPLRRTEDVPCGTDVMTATYARAISSSSSFDPSARRPPSRKCLRRAARTRRQCPKARRSAGSKRSEEH
jgi:hypothetical protein